MQNHEAALVITEDDSHSSIVGCVHLTVSHSVGRRRAILLPTVHCVNASALVLLLYET